MSDMGEPAVAARRVDVVPWVRHQVEQQLANDPRAVAQVLAQLTGGQLSGESLLPDPLPLVDAIREVGEPIWEALSDAQRRAVLAVAEVGDGRLDALLAVDDEIREALEGGSLADLILTEPHRAVIRDPRLRAFVLARASLTERAAMDRGLANAFRLLGDHALAAWHETKAMAPGEECDAAQVQAWAARLLAVGRAVSAFRVARELASKTDGADASAANLLAARSVLAAGAPADAMVYLARVDHAGVVLDQARALPLWTHAMALSTGTVPADLDARIAAVADAAQSSDERFQVRRQAAHARALAAAFAAMLGEEQAFWHHLPRVDADALAEDGIGRAWLRLASVLGDDAAVLEGAGPTVTRTDSGAHRVLTVMADSIERARTGDVRGAGRVLSSAVALTSLSASATQWSDRASPITTALGTACLRLFHVVATLWEGDVLRARTALEEGARLAPMATPIPGLDVALARRIEALVEGTWGRGAALPQRSRVRVPAAVRGIDIGSRAMVLAIAGQHAEAAMVLESDPQGERVLGFGLAPLPCVDLTGEWALAGRRKLAMRASAASDEGPITLGQAAQRARARLWGAAASRRSSGIRAMLSLAHDGGSLWDVAYGELTAGRLQALAENHERAHRHLIHARELMRDLGAAAWAEVTDQEAVLAARAGAGVRAQSLASVLPRPAAPDAVSRTETIPAGEVSVAWREVLTQREWHVATLVASGLTNREIAEQLFLSPRTVEVHLSSAFRKLGVHSRVELALLSQEAPHEAGSRVTSHLTGETT